MIIHTHTHTMQHMHMIALHYYCIKRGNGICQTDLAPNINIVKLFLALWSSNTPVQWMSVINWRANMHAAQLPHRKLWYASITSK